MKTRTAKNDQIIPTEYTKICSVNKHLAEGRFLVRHKTKKLLQESICQPKASYLLILHEVTKHGKNMQEKT